MFPKNNNIFLDIAKIKTNQKNNKNTFILRKWLQLAVLNWFGPQKY
jgi:hypothetical protein